MEAVEQVSREMQAETAKQEVSTSEQKGEGR